MERAVQYNDPTKVHLQLAKIYEAASKHKVLPTLLSSLSVALLLTVVLLLMMQLAVECFEGLMKRAPLEAELWNEYGAYHFRQQQAEEARVVLRRALERLPKQERMWSLLDCCVCAVLSVLLL